MKIKQLILALSTICFAHSSFAADVFRVTGTVTTGSVETRSFGFKKAEDVFDAADNHFLSRNFHTYTTGMEQAALDIDFRGLPMQVSYASDSNILEFSVPSLNIQESFGDEHHSREESQRRFADFMKREGGHILNQIMKKLVAVSPSDPLAGNPNSLMSRMFSSDFDTGFSNPASNVATKPTADNTSNLFGIEALYSVLRSNGLTSQTASLPLSYTVRSDIDPRRQLILKAPISYTDVEGSKAYSLGFGGAYRYPVNDSWTLTPAVNYGATGSEDLASYAQAASASLTSSYVIEADGYDIAIGNMIGYTQSLELSASGYSYDPDVSNTVFRNGIMLSQPVKAFGRSMAVEYSLIDTRFTGTELYLDQYNELRVSLGTNKNATSARSFLRGGLSYLHSDKMKGFAINVGYWF